MVSTRAIRSKHHCSDCATWRKCDAAGPCGLPCMEAGGGACAAACSHWLAVTSLISSLTLSPSLTHMSTEQVWGASFFLAFTVFSCTGSLKTEVKANWNTSNHDANLKKRGGGAFKSLNWCDFEKPQTCSSWSVEQKHGVRIYMEQVLRMRSSHYCPHAGEHAGLIVYFHKPL